MDPILASGLVSIGKSLVERMIPKVKSASSNSISFDQLLSNNIQTATPIQINKLEAAIRTQSSVLYNSPQFQEICQRFQDPDNLQLEKLEDGCIALKSSPNDKVIIPSDSELGAKLESIIRMKKYLQDMKGISNINQTYTLQNPYQRENFY